MTANFKVVQNLKIKLNKIQCKTPEIEVIVHHYIYLLLLKNI